MESAVLVRHLAFCSWGSAYVGPWMFGDASTLPF
jgi:hypothetical protein